MNQSNEPKSALRLLAVLLIILLVCGALLMAQRSYAQQPDVANQIFLPLLSDGSSKDGSDLAAFAPALSGELAGGDYTATSFHIPANVQIHLTGPLTIQVQQDVQIEGSLIADCHAIQIVTDGNLVVQGTIDNRCTSTETTPGGLTLYSNQGTLQLGTPQQPATIESDGDLDLGNAPTLADWEVALTAEQRSSSPLPPVCSANADSLIANATLADPATVHFYGAGLDPDGGPVTFAWDFGDGSSASTTNPTHDYTQASERTVVLTVSDDEGALCQSSLVLQLNDPTQGTTAPAVAFEASDLAVAVGEEISLNAAAIADQETVSVTWDFGDGASSSILSATHAYVQPGRYELQLTATNEKGETRLASGSIYVFSEQRTLFAADVEQAQAICPPNAPPPGAVLINVVNNPPKAAAGRNGANRRYRWRGDVIVAPGLNIRGGDGGDGADRNGRPLAVAQSGGDGGSLDILVAGRVTFCAGVTLAAGDGGKGGNATATAPSGQTATARGGKGGDAGDHLRVLASAGIVFEGAVTVDPGSGGDGGNATATGDAGQNRCPVADAGAHALANGGNGGRATKFAWSRGNVVGLANVTIINGLGGLGGDAEANGGTGGNAICQTTATSGTGGNAVANGGKGGDAQLTGAVNAGWQINPAAFSAGLGGKGDAQAGHGGTATATPAAACQASTASAGNGGIATGRGGDGGVGRNRGIGGEGHATGGNGGAATATGGDCNACKDGGNANANGGAGGDATATFGRPRPLGDTTASSAGNGGAATATGGRGGDCPTCPGGKGGNGGVASANGGGGGNGLGTGRRTGGDGGSGSATGGAAGNGANCCNPPQGGGNGGTGGNATGHSGKGGLPGGKTPANGNKAGDGGNGGEGKGPGSGGSGGVGAGSPFKVLDGVKGSDGKLCRETPTATPTATATATKTATATSTPTPSSTVTATATSSATPTPTGNCVTTPGTKQVATPVCTPVSTTTVTATVTVTVTAQCVVTPGNGTNNAVPCTPVPTQTVQPTATCVSSIGISNGTPCATGTPPSPTPTSTPTPMSTRVCNSGRNGQAPTVCATALP
ncbi:MAG: PKD domain-containing protein [Caldilineaceae bacterium]